MRERNGLPTFAINVMIYDCKLPTFAINVMIYDCKLPTFAINVMIYDCFGHQLRV